MSKRSRPFEMPPRGPALARCTFLVSFDVHCGEIAAGHRFIARGLADDGPAERGAPGDTDYGIAQGFSLEYELVPGVPVQTERDIWPYLVHISYEADVELPWEPADGGAIAPFEGGTSTHGSRGTWPLPNGARRLTFTINGVDPGGRWPTSEPAGELVVDMDVGTAAWHER